MTTLYVYDNELLGDNGADFDDTSCVDSITCDTGEECFAKFEADYGSNDYSASVTKHA